MNGIYEMTPAELAEWDRRTASDRDPAEALADPVWRLGSGVLYRCLDENGQDVEFWPTPEQRLVIWCILVRGWLRLIIPKARQLGMSLVLCLIGLDGVVFNEGFKAALIDKSEDDAKKKLREKVKFAFERLPADLKRGLVVKTDSATMLAVGSAGDDAALSTYEADVSFRGGTVEWEHISEWGAIQVKQRARSIEIKNGALPAVERAANGVCVVETTWEGGLDGELGPLVREAQSVPEEQKGPKSWRILFFPWFSNPLYAQSHGYLDGESETYFAELAKVGVILTHQQKLWYAEQRRTKGARSVRTEYPSLVHECWETLPEGSIYGPWIEQSRAAGRILAYEPDLKSLVHTFWDLGHPLNTVCWFVQVTPGEIRVLDVEMELDITLMDRVSRIHARGWPMGLHFLPHDAGVRQTSGRCQADDFRDALGAGNVRVVSRVGDVWQGIDSLRALFPRLVFRLPACVKGIEHLSRYSAVRESSTGIAQNIPVHDRYSHAADALRQLAQAIDSHMIQGGGSVTGAAERQGGPQPRAIIGMRGWR